MPMIFIARTFFDLDNTANMHLNQSSACLNTSKFKL